MTYSETHAACLRRVDAQRAEVAELKKRIRLARKMLLKAVGPIITGTTAWRLLDARFKLPRRSR